MPATRFTISSRCYESGCVGVGALPDGGFAIRNTRFDDGPVITFTAQEWEAFIGGVKDGEFDAGRLRSALQEA